MENIIKASDPRVLVGDRFLVQSVEVSGEEKGIEYLFLPIILDNGDFRLPKKDSSLLNLRFKGRVFHFLRKWRRSLSDDYKDFVSGRLNTEVGLSVTDARILMSRSIKQIERIEESVKGIVDPLLLAFPQFFNKGNKPMQMHLLRSVLKTCTYNIDLVTKMWKQFSNYVYVKGCQLVTRSEPKLDINNIFGFLLKSKFVEPLLSGIVDKRQASILAHLLSTRQMPSAGKKSLDISLRKFEEITTSDYQASDAFLGKVKSTAAKVGRKIQRIHGKDFPIAECHISLSRAGDFDLSILEGGRAKKILEDCEPILTFIPEEDEEIVLADATTLKTPAGVMRWKSWFRSPGFLEDPKSKGVFGELIPHQGIVVKDDIGIQVVPDARYGYDETIGSQILVCALLIAQDEGFVSGTEVLKPIPTRTIVVPEPGGKARTVSTTKWWNIILQQSPGNLLRETLRFHPSATAGLLRADQAWLYLEQLAKVALSANIENLPSNFSVLSSDLKEATDATPKCIARALLEGYIEGIGYGGNHLMQLATSLVCSDREVSAIFTDDTKLHFLATRGVMMGEPMTKAILTLTSLVAEEMAIRDFEENPDGPIKTPWRCFAVGGDDHIAIGPDQYLNRITANFLAMGSLISEEKHGMSRLAVKYCEKVLFFKNTDLRVRAHQVNLSTYFYENSIFVDSVKVRLLSPLSKAIEVKNDRNIAIGKAKSLGRTLRWLNTEYFPIKWIRMVRERFFQRMKHYLPAFGTSLYYQSLLPQVLGGLDLYIEDELPKALLRCPLPTFQVACKMVEGSISMYEMREVSGYVTNDASRGISIKDKITKSHMTEGLDHRENLGLQDLRERYFPENPQVSVREIFSRAKKEGWFPVNDAIALALRGYEFNELLTKESGVVVFNTTPWRKRYQILWDRLIDNEYVPSDELVERVVSTTNFEKFNPVRFINLDQETIRLAKDVNGDFLFDEDGRLVTLSSTFREELTKGMPDLKIHVFAYKPDAMVPKEPDIPDVLKAKSKQQRLLREAFGDSGDDSDVSSVPSDFELDLKAGSEAKPEFSTITLRSGKRLRLG